MESLLCLPYLPSQKRLSSKTGDFFVALKSETPYFRAFPAFCNYSSPSRVTTCNVMSFAILQDIEDILSGIELSIV